MDGWRRVVSPLSACCANCCGIRSSGRSRPRPPGASSSDASLCASFCASAGVPTMNDIIATATALTARSIGIAVRSFVLPLLETGDAKPARFREFVVSGGGTKNATLMRMIREELAPSEDAGAHHRRFRTCHRRRKRRRRSRCWPIRPGGGCRPMFLPRPERSVRRSSARSAMRKVVLTTEDTERTEKTGNLFTTETQRHREIQRQRKRIQPPIQGLKEFRIPSVRSAFSVVNLRSGLSLCLCVSVVYLSCRLRTQARSQHAGHDHREQSHQSRSARGSRFAIAAHRRAAV